MALGLGVSLALGVPAVAHGGPPVTVPAGFQEATVTGDTWSARSRDGLVRLAVQRQPLRWTADIEGEGVALELRALLTGMGASDVSAASIAYTPEVEGVAFKASLGGVAALDGVLVPAVGGGVWRATCERDPARAKAPIVKACVDALSTLAQVAVLDAEPPPFTAPPGFRRSLGLLVEGEPSTGEDGSYWALDERGGQLAYLRAKGVLLDAPADTDVISKLTDEVSRGGVQVQSLTAAKIGDVRVFRYTGLRRGPGGSQAVLGYFMPRGRETLLLVGAVPGDQLGPYEAAFDATARSMQGLKAPPEGSRNAQTYAAADRAAAGDGKRAATPGASGHRRRTIIVVSVGGALALGALAWALAGRGAARRRRREEMLARARREG